MVKVLRIKHSITLWEQKLLEVSHRVYVPKFNPTRWNMKVNTLSSVLIKYEDIRHGIICLQSTGDANRDAAS